MGHGGTGTFPCHDQPHVSTYVHLNKNEYLPPANEVCRCLSVHGGRGGVRSLSGGILSRGISVQGGLCPGGVSVQGGLCPGGLCPGGLCLMGLSGGSLSRGSLSGVSLQGVSVSLMFGIARCKHTIGFCLNPPGAT